MRRSVLKAVLVGAAMLVAGCSSSKESIVKKGQHRSSSGPRNERPPHAPTPEGR